MNCHAVRNIWDYYWDSRLLPEMNNQVNAHLSACAGCAREAEFERSMRKLLIQKSAIPKNLSLPQDALIAPAAWSWRDWFSDASEEFVPAYALAIIYLCLTPLLNATGARLF